MPLANGFIVSTVRGVQVFGPQLATDIVEVGAVSTPSLIFCGFLVPLGAWETAGGQVAKDDIIDPSLYNIELAISNHHATDARFEQQIKTSGLIVNYLVFTVTAESNTPVGSAPVQGELRVNVEDLKDRSLALPYLFDPLDALYDQLVAFAS